MKKPNEASLHAMLLEKVPETATQEGESAWRGKYVSGLAEFIGNHPLRYRAFGPYWWLVKSAMLSRGILDFGEEVDASAIEALDYGNETANLAAAYIYSEVCEELGNTYSSDHAMEGDDGEPISYHLSDTEIERIAAARTLV